MKFSPNICRARRTGFTLPEILIAMTIFVVIIGAVVALQLFGVRIYYLASTKLTATHDGRKTINLIREQVREAKTIYIGNYNNSGSSGTFSEVGDNTNQIGSALLLFPTTNTTYGTIFFQKSDAVASNFCSVSISGVTVDATGLIFSGSISGLATNALFVTNNLCFQAENYSGTVLTNNNNNRVIHVTLQFCELEYPVAGIGTNEMYDYYQLHTRATRRTID
jgi:prepilin-type N-terminal cleavage/methylation domain-containing protein